MIPFLDTRSSFYLDQPALVVIGKPSAKLADTLAKETADRLAKTRTRLGEDGLKKIERRVEDAQKENDRPIPPEMLSSFKVPDVGGIRWIDVQSGSAGSNSKSFKNRVQEHLSGDQTELPYFLQFERE